LHTFEDIIRENLAIPRDEPLVYDRPLVDYGLDSFTAVNIIADLEQQFGIVFPDERIVHAVFSSAATLRAALAELTGGEQHQPPSAQSWQGIPSGVLLDVVHAEPLSGGGANEVWGVSLADGAALVVKCTSGVDDGAFPSEADGLEALRLHGGVRTPRVIEVSPRHLVLEKMLPATDSPRFWEEAGRAVAGLHSVRGERFGWTADGWLGLLRQENTWTDDGHEFFTVHRVLRYLREPKVLATLDAVDLIALERICDRLPSLVPAMPCVLNHGDLYRDNIVSNGQGEPVFIDPAVCWMWPESDLSMMYCTGRTPDSFFKAYEEVSPLNDGWRERMPLLHLRELLSVVAHFGDSADCVARIRSIIRAFS
jgi:fructosamine-3-kinase/acyl carrier protein